MLPKAPSKDKLRRGDGKFEASFLDERQNFPPRLRGRARDAPGAAPFAVNQIVHKSNSRLMQDMEVIVKHEVPIVITSLGARKEVNDAVHSYGGIVLHDIINNRFAKKAVEERFAARTSVLVMQKLELELT